MDTFEEAKISSGTLRAATVRKSLVWEISRDVRHTVGDGGTHTSLCVCVYVGGLGEREALHPAGVIDIDRLMHLPLNPQNTWGIVGEDMRWKRTWQRLT